MKSVEERLAHLEAADQIRALKMTYARLCDAGYPTAELRQLFTPDAVWDGGRAFGRHEGWPEIEEFFAGADTRVDWALHYTVAGDVRVAEDGRSATGTWYLWQPMTLDGSPVWLMGRYQDDYVRSADAWRHAHVRLDVQAVTPIDKGWVAERFAGSA
ncbi:nuclear transport factor 2 family protein [Amycolatopsis rhabdoformis]|uniref:Nuclear transport factor 2 family protein n=1 Tax=Amycolatopsis rhabdoformis TaxID=1448059 RepID=A0ABZ1IKN9_9PSEU|nr:nuclear transport factor 2 family protein [Amycolatopsis rhabdoformis]WSE34764.1 nuclear transport factor 2 family protein [Amycolatopsis rhabdoformis]